MARLDSTKATVEVLTFKDGLLSAVAHDLKLQVGRFTIDAEAEKLTGEFDTASLRVIEAMKDGRESPGALSTSMKAEIEKNIVHDVLDARRHPSARFETTVVTADRVEGALTLHGVTKAISGRRADVEGQRVVEFRLDQRDFGIKPYSAMLGTLKIKPEVVVRVSVPA
ncbi:MAG: YceI family protein [Myxococcus sp.]|nr:YceI family protein [Myxococcus sp.]